MIHFLQSNLQRIESVSTPWPYLLSSKTFWRTLLPNLVQYRQFHTPYSNHFENQQQWCFRKQIMSRQIRCFDFIVYRNSGCLVVVWCCIRGFQSKLSSRWCWKGYRVEQTWLRLAGRGWTFGLQHLYRGSGALDWVLSLYLRIAVAEITKIPW